MIITCAKKIESHPLTTHLDVIKLDNIYKNPNRIQEFIDLYYQAKNEDQQFSALLRIIHVLPYYYPGTFGFNDMRPIIDHWLSMHDINKTLSNKNFKGTLIHFSLKNIELFNYLLSKKANLSIPNSLNLKVYEYYHHIIQSHPYYGYSLDLSFYKTCLDLKESFDFIPIILNLAETYNSIENNKVICKVLNQYFKRSNNILNLHNILMLYSNSTTCKITLKNKIGFTTIPLLKDLSYLKGFSIQNYKKHQYLFQLIFNCNYLTEAMSIAFNCSSKSFKKAFFDYLTDKKWHLNLDGDKLSVIKFICELFLIKTTPNHSDCINLIAEQKGLIVTILPEWLNATNQRFFLSFLNNFTDSQKKFLLTSNCDKHIFNDTIAMYAKFPRELNRSMTLKKWNELSSFDLIHDFFVKESSKFAQPNFLLNQEKFFINAKFLKGIRLNNGMYFNLAEDQHQLIDWGNKMGHCIGTAGYGSMATEGGCLLIAVMKEKEPIYAIEIRSFKIVQIQGKNHSKPDQSLMNEISQKLRKLGLIN